MITRTQSAGLVTYQRRQRSIWASVTSVLVQPVTFYRTFPTARQWLWAALIILAVTGFSAIHQPSIDDAADNGSAGLPIQPLPEGMGGEITGGAISPDGGFIPPPDMGASVDTADSPDVSRTVMTALLAAGGVVLAWVIQALLLCEVSLINGVSPSFGRGLQIAVWAGIPIALMLVIQQVYYAIGGTPGQPGISLLLDRWAGFHSLPAFSQSVLMTLTSNFTLFWLWSLALLYIGGREVLNGKRTAVILVVVAWVIISAILPALTAKPSAETTVPDGITLPPESSEMLPEFGEGDLFESDGGAEIVPRSGGSITIAPGARR